MNVFKYQDINISDIKHYKYPNSIFLKYKDSLIRFVTPIMITEGIEKKYGVHYLNLEFGAMDTSESLWEYDPIENKDLIDFYKFINDIDNNVQYYLRKAEPTKQFIPSIKNERNKVLRIRLPTKYDCEFFNLEGKRILSFDIKKGDQLSCLLEIKNVWSFGKGCGITFVAKKVVLCAP